MCKALDPSAAENIICLGLVTRRYTAVIEQATNGRQGMYQKYARAANIANKMTTPRAITLQGCTLMERPVRLTKRQHAVWSPRFQAGVRVTTLYDNRERRAI